MNKAETSEKKMNVGAIIVGGIAASTIILMQRVKMGKMNSQIDTLKERLESELSINDVLKSKLERIHNDGVAVDYQESIEQYQQINELNKKVSVLNKELSSKKIEIGRLQKQCVALEANYRSAVQEKNDEIYSLCYEIESLKQIIAKSDKSNPDTEKLIKENKELKSKVEGLNKEIQIYKDKCNGQIEKITELKRQLQESINELDLFKSQIKYSINIKTKESDILKDLSRKTDRVSKKINKNKGKNK